jgi:predicted glycoside hydrolase/deacetylase ChbG (UPF0249 family)
LDWVPPDNFHTAEERSHECRVLCDPQLAASLAANGIELHSFGTL